LQESRFIESTGGEYVGFVSKENGLRQFEDLRVSRCAYYDEEERTIVEGFVATEAVNEDGTNELAGPDEVVGFTLLMIRRDLSGNELGRPGIIALRPANFSTKHLSTKELSRLARDLHDLIVQDVSRFGGAQAFRHAKARLGSEGWNDDRNI
jgi:signal transduction histidine kinase